MTTYPYFSLQISPTMFGWTWEAETYYFDGTEYVTIEFGKGRAATRAAANRKAKIWLSDQGCLV